MFIFILFHCPGIIMQGSAFSENRILYWFKFKVNMNS